MANAASTIEIELEIRDAINRLGRLERELTKSSQSFDRAAQATRKFEGAINKAKAGLVAFFAAISVQKLAQLSDAMTQFENRVKLATNSLVQQLAVQQQLFLVAQKTALPLEDVGQLYSRLRIAAEQLGASQRDLINLTETVGLALKASGTSAASAQGALLQLGQALNSPRVQAEEFNSLIDGMPNLLREVEKQLGLTAGGLKKFVTDGQLSNKKFFDAILASQKALTQQANSSASTIEQANQRVANSFTSLIGAIDDKLGASKFFTGFIDGLASGIDKLSNFLGLTTQATGGGGANLDEVIRGAAPSGSQYAFPTIGPERVTAAIGGFPNYIQEIKSLEEIQELEDGLSEIRIEQAKAIAQAVNANKETVDILGAQNVPLEEAVGFLNLENKLIESNIQKRKIELQQNKENLTYLEQATNYLKEQFGLTDRTAGAIVSGISGAGPNASRATNIAQSKTVEEAAAKLILSNEKVAKAIDSSFELLFEVLDPFIDLLGDLISAINRLIGALAKGIGDGIQSVLNQAGVGQDSYLFGGGFASDFEQFSFDISGGMFGVNNRPTGMSAEEFQSFSLELWQRSSADAVSELLKDLGQVGFSSIREGIESEYQKVVERIQSMSSDDVTDEQRTQLLKNAAAANETLINRLNQQFRAMSNDKTVELLKEINERGIERNRIDQIRIDYTKEINQVTEDLSLTEEDQTRVINALIRARDREIESIERQQQLLQLQSVQSDLQSLFSDFENTIEAISELVQSLFDQVNDLLFSEFNLAGPQEAFALAQGTYESLLANAFDPDATEEDIEALQGFVNDYLSAARDVFKSSTAFTTIFEGVLSDLALLGTQYGFNAPIAAASTLSSGAEDLLGDLPEELQDAVSDLISGINLATLAFAQQQVEFLTTVYQIPIELEDGNFLVDTSGVNKEISLNSSNFSLDSSKLNLSLLMSSSMFTVNTSGLNFGTITPTATAGRPDLGTVYPIVSLGTPNLGTITPAVSAGIPNLGVITPTLTLDTSNITSSLNSLSTIINDAFSLMIGAVQLQATILEAQASNIEAAGSSAGNPITLLAGGTLGSKYGKYPTGVAAIGSIAVNMQDNVDYTNGGLSPGFQVASALTPDQQFASIYNKLPETAPQYLNKPYYVLLSAQSGTESEPKLLAFDEITKARDFFNYYSTTTGLYGWDAPVFKYGFRRGGLVDPMDTIPAMLSPGEYILSPETVRRYGVSNLNRLNAGDSAAINATSDPEVKRLLTELIVAVRENDTEVHVYTDMEGRTKASIEEFRSELRERTRRQGDKFLPARYI